jgi:hypothetical protein
MKHETTCYVSECDTCQKVKAGYMKPGRLLRPLCISDWKWDDISMDFIVGLPLTACKFDLIWGILDRLTKSTHFIPISSKYRVRSMLKSISLVCYVCMEFQRRSSPIKGHILLLASENNCMPPLGLT